MLDQNKSQKSRCFASKFAIWYKINMKQNQKLLKFFCEKCQIFLWNFWFYACEKKIVNSEFLCKTIPNACPAKGNLPLVGFKPTMPQLWAGLRMLPPESDPAFCRKMWNFYHQIRTGDSTDPYSIYILTCSYDSGSLTMGNLPILGG